MKNLVSSVALAVIVAALAQNAGAQDIAVVDSNSRLVVDGTPIATNMPVARFVRTPVGSNNVRQYFIQNESTQASLIIQAITITGTHAAEFVVTDPGPAVIGTDPANDGGSFIISFTPAAIGTRNAQVNVFSNDPDGEGIYTFAISGDGFQGADIAQADLYINQLIPKTKASGNGTFKVSGKAEVENRGNVLIEEAIVETYRTSKRYLDNTAEFISSRQLKNLKPYNPDKPKIKKVKYKVETSEPTGRIFLVITPLEPVSEKDWDGNTSSSYTYPVLP